MSSRRGAGRGSRSNGGQGLSAASLARHLESEDPDTSSPEVARLWAGVYDQLVTFEQQTLDRMQELLPVLSPEARHEAEISNVPMIAQHLQTFRYRRAHWRKRVQDLAG